jgi:hypothetical protein
MRDRALGEHTDIERVAIADDARAPGTPHGERGDTVVTPRLRHEAVRRGTDVGELLRAVDLQVARTLCRSRT